MSHVIDPEIAPERSLSWFCGLLAMMVAFQVARLMQGDPANWLALDYLMRGSTLFLLGVGPMRSVLLTRVRPCVSQARFVAWCVALAMACIVLVAISMLTAHLLPGTRLARLPHLPPMLRVVDLTFGIALVAVHEELFFRRFASLAFQRLGDGVAMMAVTTTIFGLFHWWTGVPNMVVAAAFGALCMVFYQRTGVLWPAMVAHYLVDAYLLA